MTGDGRRTRAIWADGGGICGRREEEAKGDGGLRTSDFRPQTSDLRLVTERSCRPYRPQCDVVRHTLRPEAPGYWEMAKKMERETGIEPATSSLGSWRSTAELLPLTANESMDISCVDRIEV